MIKTKEELYGTKIRTNGRNEEILIKLRELGCKDLTENFHIGLFMDSEFVYLDRDWGEEELNWSEHREEDYFRKHENREITVEELLDMREYVLIVYSQARNNAAFEVAEDYGYTNKVGSSWIEKDTFYGITKDKEIYLLAGVYDQLPQVTYKGSWCRVLEKFDEITREGVKETVVVSKEFVLEAHKAACSGWKRKIEKELPELFPKTTYRIGQRFMDVSRNIEYILARAVDKEVILVNLIDGNGYSESVPVGNVKAITESEWRKITNGDHKDFKLIE